MGRVKMGPLHYHPFRWFFAGRFISLLGSSMAPVALAFAVLQYAKGAGDLGIVLAARSIPLLIFLLIGGAVADRLKRSTVLLASNVGAAVTQGAVASLLIAGDYHLAAIAALEFANGVLTAFTTPAMRGIVPQLVSPEEKQRANALLGTTKNAISIFGPTVSGVIVTAAGGGWAVAFDAVTYAVAALCMARLKLPDRIPGTRSNFLKEIREGWVEFRSLTWVCATVAAFAVTNCIYVGVWNTLGPQIAKASIGATSWGIVLSARAIGILVMSVIMYRVTVRHFLAMGQIAYALFALPLIILGLHGSVYLLALAALIAGLGTGMLAIAWETSLQEHVPNSMLSRVSSYDDLGSYLAVPIGQIAAGPAAALYSPSEVSVVGGALFGLAALSPLLSSTVRRLEQPRSELQPTRH